MLSDLNLKRSYRSDHDDIIASFYIPCLSQSSLYSRAVGFFSSSALAVAAKGLQAFIGSGGMMRLVASPMLSESDVQAIKRGYSLREDVEARALAGALDGQFGPLVQHRLGLLAWLIAHNRLEIKVAVLAGEWQPGIYHEKLGVFSDGRNVVAFTGSPNESASGLVSNFECVDVYCSWRAEDVERAWEKDESFGRLWHNTTAALRVYSFPEAARRSLLRFRSEKPTDHPEHTYEDCADYVALGGSPKKPDSLLLRPYQVEAVANWFRANGKGTLKMATGSGKTVVALAVIERLFRDIDLRAAVVVVPYRHLVTQWGRECRRFGLDPIRCSESKSTWFERVQSELLRVKAASGSFLAVIATNATFVSPHFQGLLSHFPDKTILIADEVHNLGARRLSQALPPGIVMRLGLSATPERWFDDRGTQALFDYFGQVIQPEFTIRDALNAGALVPYTYHPILVELTDEEAESYLKLSRRIGKLFASGVDQDSESPYLTALLMRRARLIASAQNKLSALREIMAGRLDTTHSLFYCGDGKANGGTSREPYRYIDQVCSMLGAELGYRVETYTAETSIDEREELRSRLVSGELQGLVAIRCLDEGVDIPLIRTAFILASSTNPRQFIQRRGRVLRPHPGKERAEIFDFIAIPPYGLTEDLEVERRLLKRELLRYVEFADLAVNAGQVRGRLVELQVRFGLLRL